MRKIAVALALGLALGNAAAAEMSEDQKTFYALGQVLARNVSVFNLNKSELDAVQKGFRDGVLGSKTAVDMSVYGPKIQPLAEARQTAAAQKSAAAGQVLLEKAAAAKGAEKTSSGVVYLSLREGKGAQPQASDVVRVNYRGTLPDGVEFDSSYKRNEPTEFPLNGVIPCWTEGVQKMKVGGKARLTCPPATAYGERGAGGVIPPNATLTFEVELLDVKKAAAAKQPAGG
jgi:FKBP-type peptidyl-prolyl cis-trans isomerase FkpA